MNVRATQDIIFRPFVAIQKIVLNRPKALNALNLSMIRTLTPEILNLRNNSQVNCIFQVGAGEKAFCAGGDVVSLYENGKSPETREKVYSDGDGDGDGDDDLVFLIIFFPFNL